MDNCILKGRHRVTSLVFILFQLMRSFHAGDDIPPTCPDESWTLLQKLDRCVKFVEYPDGLNHSLIRKKCQDMSRGIYKIDLVALSDRGKNDAVCEYIEMGNNTRHYVTGLVFDTSSPEPYPYWEYYGRVRAHYQNFDYYYFNKTFACTWVKKEARDNACVWGSYECSVPQKYAICETFYVNPCEDKTKINGGCEKHFVCRNKGKGRSECVCHEGYEFTSDKTGCKDIDECFSTTTPTTATAATGNAKCSQKCVNTAGSFKCECDKQNFLPGAQPPNGPCVCKEGHMLERVSSICLGVGECSYMFRKCNLSETCERIEGGFHCCVRNGTQYCPMDTEEAKGSGDDESDKDNMFWYYFFLAWYVVALGGVIVFLIKTS